MKRILLLMLIVSNYCNSQQVGFKSIGRIEGKDSVTQFRELSIFNSTSKPICIPVSSIFTTYLKNDTIELVLQKVDRSAHFSLRLSTDDIEKGYNVVPVYPLILNPRTSFVVKLKIIIPKEYKERILEFQYFDDERDYCKLPKDFWTSGRWTEDVSIKTKKIPIKSDD